MRDMTIVSPKRDNIRKGMHMMASIMTLIHESAGVKPLPNVDNIKPRRLVVTKKAPDLTASIVHLAARSGDSAPLRLWKCIRFIRYSISLSPWTTTIHHHSKGTPVISTSISTKIHLFKKPYIKLECHISWYLHRGTECLWTRGIWSSLWCCREGVRTVGSQLDPSRHTLL